MAPSSIIINHICILTFVEDIAETSILSVTASQGVYIKQYSDRAMGPGSDYDEILTAVIGLDIQYDSLFKMFNVTTQICSDSIDCETSKCNRDVS